VSLVSVSLVIPCFNEEDGIQQLQEKLLPVVERLKMRYDIELIFVDDGSTDSTYEKLNSAFANRGARILRHERNQNLGAATRTGLQNANGDWVAFLDSDCTYEPDLLEPMLNKMTEGSDLVTLSPYHPQGKVEGVAGYRLFLSKSLSAIYRMILRKPVYTYTAMARVYKREIYSTIQSPANDFTAIAEMMLKALSQDYRVDEVPAILSVRRFGESKMKTVRVIRAHLQLIRRLVLKPSTYMQ
jgi:dolichol-phosphate mannosyltransferase